MIVYLSVCFDIAPALRRSIIARGEANNEYSGGPGGPGTGCCSPGGGPSRTTKTAPGTTNITKRTTHVLVISTATLTIIDRLRVLVFVLLFIFALMFAVVFEITKNYKMCMK